ncbi:hypothetical protein [uncultured Mailhella sp.]|uniref:hypothetical protein n=1 Tax=uncultured Mailhella sp. TaxID=1981031 RepID=UPI0025DDF1C5|nr:hypothetical protein [uncultured Mailhella sp.]
MNRIFITLVGASVAALVLAVACGSWLFFQSWEEGKRLERQNRELRASLEASRIRLENFCDYPAEALCEVDAPKGSVSGAMSGVTASSLPEPAQKAAEDKKNAGESPKSSTLTPPAPENQTPSSANAAETQDNTPKPAAPKDAAAAGQTPAAPANAAPQAKNAPGHVSADSPRSAAAPARAKKTWTSMDLKKDSMQLDIAGEGSSLTAEGQLLSDPLRYEVTMQGLWNVSNRHPQTTLIKDMQSDVRNGNTVLTFPLSEKPGECNVVQRDRRTISIVIR